MSPNALHAYGVRVKSPISVHASCTCGWESRRAHLVEMLPACQRDWERHVAQVAKDLARLADGRTLQVEALEL